MTNVQKETWLQCTLNVNYNISDHGRVKNVKGMVLKPTDNGNGYLIVSFLRGHKRRNYYIHRLVALMFVDNPDNFGRVNHKDGNKYNNHRSNLEWCTAKYNSVHAVENGLIKSGFDHFNTTPILDLETGVFYAHIKEAARAKNIVWQTLYTWLKKPRINRSSLIYV